VLPRADHPQETLAGTAGAVSIFADVLLFACHSYDGAGKS